MPPLQVILALIGVVLIIFAAPYATYYIGNKASGQSRRRLVGRNIKLLEQFAISKDKSFCIVEIAGKVYIVAVTNQSMTLLDTIEAFSYEQFVAHSESTLTQGKSTGGLMGNRFVSRLASFIAQKRGMTSEADNYRGREAESFAANMKTASDNNISGQRDSVDATPPGSSEGEE